MCPDTHQFICTRNVRACRNIQHADKTSCDADSDCGWSERAKVCLPKALSGCLTKRAETDCTATAAGACQWYQAKGANSQPFCASTVYAKCSSAVDMESCSTMPECVGGCQKVEEEAEPPKKRCPLTPSQEAAGVKEGVEPDFKCFRDHSTCNRQYKTEDACKGSTGGGCGWMGSRYGCVNKQLASCYMVNFKTDRGAKCEENSDCHWDGRICLSVKHVACGASESEDECRAIGGCTGRFSCRAS